MNKKVELVSNIVPYSEIEEFGHKILEIQVENHFVNKGMKDPEHTELFLFTPKELREISREGLVSITTTKEDGVYTQKVVGYAVATPSDLAVKNSILSKVFKKLKEEEKLEKFFVVDAFMSCSSKTNRGFIQMVKKIEGNIGTGTKVFCPIYSGNKNFLKIIEIFGLQFEYGPEQTISTTEIGVIHLPYKILTA